MKYLAIMIIISSLIPVFHFNVQDEFLLPPPLKVDLPLEISIARRVSVREFSEKLVEDEKLSTILWAAYGYTKYGKRTVYAIDGKYSAEVYVLKEDAVYKYNPKKHSLILFKEGDYRKDVAQYDAPIQIGIVWNKSKNDNENLSSALIGEIARNIAFMANALELGTVVTVGFTLHKIGLPSDEIAKIIMPLGYPKYPYDFIYKPMLLPFSLPCIKNSTISLSTAIEERREKENLTGNISLQELSQILWASYGFSYYIDDSEAELNPIIRHRVLPSAHAYYPLCIYAITPCGIYRYFAGLYRYYMWNLPVLHCLVKIRNGDYRNEIANASSMQISSAPLIIISLLDLRKARGMIGLWDDLSTEEYRWLWYHEAGASAHNILLEATAWNLSANIATPTDISKIRNILLTGKNFIPLLVVPVGK